MAGQRYMSDLVADNADLRERFEESVEVVLLAMASERWLSELKLHGWEHFGENCAKTSSDLPV